MLLSDGDSNNTSSSYDAINNSTVMLVFPIMGNRFGNVNDRSKDVIPSGSDSGTTTVHIHYAPQAVEDHASSIILTSYED